MGEVARRRQEDLAAALERSDTTRAQPTASFVGKVINNGALSTAADRYVLVNPVALGGTESEGTVASQAVLTGVKVPVLAVGANAPVVNDLVVCHQVGPRWVTRKGIHVVTNANPTPCGPCNLPATGTAITTPIYTVTLTYRASGGGTGSVTKSLYWVAASSLWCTWDQVTPANACVFILTDYDTVGWLTDNANFPCTNFTVNSNHVIQVLGCGGISNSIQIRHLVTCPSGTSGRTFTFFPGTYPLTSTTCSSTAGGTTIVYSRTDTAGNPDKTFTLNW